MKIDININERGVGWHKVSDRYGTLHRIVGANILRHGENLIRFHLTCEDYCYVKLGDAVIHWQNTI